MGSVWFGRAGALVVAFGLGVAATAQSTPPVCGLPPISAASSRPNIFSEQQEEWLGEAMADLIEGEYRPARDPAASAYLQSIADRLVATLPPTTTKYRVLLIDSDEINGFSIAGGHIYIMRKLATAAHSEDELASVLGHEIGHIASHQFAFETTADLKRLLGVTSVGDRADVYEKFQKLMDARMHDKHASNPDDDDKQDEADRVSMYAIAAAGYRPQAFSDFWNRVFFVKGKTGGRFSDFFGMTKPNEKRLRGIQKLVAALPPGCGATKDRQSPGFVAWEKDLIANKAGETAMSAKPIKQVTLTPSLRMELDRVHYSRDGKLLLAQDEGSIFVLTRDPLAVLFQADAEDALGAEFSPDSSRVVFHTAGLHTEEWSVAEKKQVAAHEIVAQHECVQTVLSPDGRSLVCVSFDRDRYAFDFAVLDTTDGHPVLEKKGFYVMDVFQYAITMAMLETGAAGLFPATLSADGNLLLIGPGESKIGIDFRTRTQLKIVGDLKSKVTGGYAFLGNDKVIGVNLVEPSHSGVFNLADGKQLSKMMLPLRNVEAVSNPGNGGPILLTYLPKQPGISLAEVDTQKIHSLQTHAMDYWDGTILGEGTDGGLALTDMTGKVKSRVVLPQSPLGPLRSVSLSPSGRYLAMSARYRGGIWDLKTGHQTFLVHGFTGVRWGADDTLFADFAKVGEADRHMGEFSMTQNTLKTLSYTVDDKTHMRYGLLMEWKPSGKKGTELVMHDPKDNAVVWNRVFAQGEPVYTSSVGDEELIFSYPLKSEAAKELLKDDAGLATQAAAVKNKDQGRLIEIVATATGKVATRMVIELPVDYAGIDGLNRAGDVLYLSGRANRTLVYSVSTGKQLRQVFGYVIALDLATQRVCLVNRRDEAVVYDAEGKELAHFHSGSTLRFASFQAKATQLVLLTADQVVRTVDVAQGDAGTAVATNVQ